VLGSFQDIDPFIHACLHACVHTTQFFESSVVTGSKHAEKDIESLGGFVREGRV